MRGRVHRLTVGTVPLLVDESAVLRGGACAADLDVRRAPRRGHGGAPATRSPVGVEVRREPPTDQDGAGGMTRPRRER
jgi:hypothetical protein